MARRTPFQARAAFRTRSGLRHLRRAIGEETNPMSRPLDLARSRALLLAALGVALAALLAAGAAYAHLADARRQAVGTASHLHPLEAVVLTPARQAAAAVGFKSAGYRAESAWTYPPGQRTTGTVDAPRQVAPGSTTTVWVGDTGRLAAAPPSAADVAADAVCVGLFTLGGLSVLIASGLGMRLRSLDRRAAEAWERSWAGVEPVWTGRTSRKPRTDDTKQS